MMSSRLAKKVFLAFLTLCLLLAIGCSTTPDNGNDGQPDAKEPVVFRLDWVITGYHAPYYYALSEGYYEEEGLDVTILPGQGSGPGLMAVISGQDTFGLIDASLMAKYALDKAPVQMVMGVFQKTPFAILSPAERGIQKPEDLNGKSTSSAPGSVTQMFLPAFLKANNIPAEQVKFISMDAGSLVPSVVEGKVDTIISWGFMQAPLIRAMGVKEVNIIPIGDYGITLPGNGIVAASKTINEKPEVVKAFLKATIRGIEEARKNPDAAIEALGKYHPDAVKGKESTHKEILLGFYDLLTTERTAGKPLGWMAEEDWADAIKLLVDYKMLSKTIEPKALYTNDFLP